MKELLQCLLCAIGIPLLAVAVCLQLDLVLRGRDDRDH